jgi:TRAP-type C4-dicarboxylate transport system permease small subunit
MLFTEPAPVRKLRSALTRLDSFMAAAALFLLLVLVCAQVMLRNLFDSGVPNLEVLARYLVLYITFFGAALAIERHRHIRIDAIAACLDMQQVRRLRPPLYLISMAICMALAWGAWRFWYDDWQYVAAHQRWASVLALITPFGFCLLAVHFLLGGLFTHPDTDKS